ncbi:branched-chain amino acid ABC transporter permease [Auritidibacter ignavus]|uniref:branched-chain amino acid ABC transporter permease n=1 Tax=Auritidibacter ignavus TaxID=678932 RepID=UPI00244BF1E1|nr:branched-chain amino acid ABC transporter permease [Auritidibacter ignavus]WGH90100.1 branched-chain amino acid ABC transporter permease [Auritidibacter ignavus]
MKLTLQGIGMIAVAVALLFAPLALTENQYLLRVLTQALCYATAVYGLNIILGYTGQLSLAQAGFFAIGVYTVALLTAEHDWPFWGAFFVGMILTTVVGFIAGLVALRTREAYFAVFTMALGLIIYMVLSRWTSVTGGYDGVRGIKFPENIGPIDFSEPTVFYFLMVLVVAFCIYLTYTLKTSNVGRTLLAIRTSEDLASSIGINVGLNKQLAFTASAGLAGTAGGLFASAQGFIEPEVAHIDLTFELLMFLLVGGMATVMGPLIGTLLVMALFELFQDFQSYRFLFLGPIIIALIIFMPQGLIGKLNELIARRRRRKTTSAPQRSQTTEHTEKESVSSC